MPPSADQKTEKPTARRRKRAREQGTVAQSAEINNALVLFGAVAALAIFGGGAFGAMVRLLNERLGDLGGVEVTMEGTATVLYQSAIAVGGAVLPVMLCIAVVGVLCSLAQTGVLVVPQVIKPDLRHVDPIQGLKRMFGLSGLMRLLVALVKITAIGVIAYFLLRDRVEWLFALAGKSVWGVLTAARSLCLSLMARIIPAMLAVAVLDYAFQRWRFEKQLMMSKTELREERKRDEGDPEVRGRQAQMRRAIARSRMIQAVPDATVVVTNPTHIAVALKWDQESMSAPKVVAKGQDLLAERIRQVARENGVPVLERKVLAAALYKAVEVGTEIPPKLYYAVAEVLAFVLRKRQRPQAGGSAER